MNAVNLIPATRRAARRRARRLRAWTFIAGGVGLAMAIAAIPLLSTTDSEAASIASDMRVTLKQLTDADADIQKLQPLIKQAERSIQAANSVGKHPDWSVLLAMLSAQRLDQITLESCELTEVKPVVTSKTPPKPGTPEPPALPVLRLTGYGNNQSAVSEYALRLQDLGVFSKVTPAESRTVTIEKRQLTWFRFECPMSTVALEAPASAAPAKGKTPPPKATSGARADGGSK